MIAIDGASCRYAAIYASATLTLIDAAAMPP